MVDKKDLIKTIIEGPKTVLPKELEMWIRESEENKKEYLRYKNSWALLQQGKEMTEEEVAKDLVEVKAKMNRSIHRTKIRQFFKYAAILTITLLGGYSLSYINTGNEVALNEISVPKGNRTLITLPDESKVWLTNGSKLIYPETFRGETRDVELQGEAFFTVAHNAKKTFVVTLGEHKVKVLGTEFSVLSYPDDNTIQVDLISGKVQIDVHDITAKGDYESVILKPSHSLVLDKTSGRVSLAQIPDSFFRYWKEGVYAFEDELFVDLAKKINRIFGVELIFEDETIKRRKFTGTFNIDDNIYTMMEVFKHASGHPFDFKIERNKIYIKKLNE